MKVLFIHGLEAGVNGHKAKYLRSHFDTCVPFMERPFNLIASILLIIENIRKFRPDVVVGSSYGGFVALLLLQLGEWKGPTVLLAQATGKIFPNRLYLPKNTVCTIVHGRGDETIDVRGSRSLYSSSSPSHFATYIENDEAHGLAYLNSGNTLKELVEEVNARYNKLVPQKPKASSTPLWWLRIKLLFFVAFNLLRNIKTIYALLTYKKKV